MRTNFFYILLIVCLILSGCDEQKYATGKDTIVSFGDGTYQILRGKSEDTLFNLSKSGTEQVVEPVVYNYEKKGGYVYIIGMKGYTKINYLTKEMIQKESLEFFNIAEQEIFNTIKKDMK